MRKKILIALAAIVGIVAVFVGVVAMQPSEFRVTRTATISAPPPAVFAQVNDFHSWQAWSPWARLDPEAKVTFEGPAAGVGAIFRWAGNDEVGEGSMTITESRPSELIRIKLEFLKPFPATSTTEFTFQPEGNQTVVTWSMSGRNNLIGKAFCLFMNMDTMVGGDFEKGLENMKAITEAATQREPTQESSMKAEPQKEHQWLHKLVGEWTYEVEAMMGPDQPPEKAGGTESVRSLGGLWVLAEGQGEMPGGEPATTLMTLGYDPQKKRYVGTWVGSMMTLLWVYEGELDAAERVLTLNAEGPDMTAEGKTAMYKDVIEFQSDDHRVLTSHVLGDDGQWTQFMTAHYRRKK